MPSTVEQLKPSRVKLTVEIPFSELQPLLAKAYREIAQNVTIPGFRKGKVPAAVINQRFGRGAVLQEAINEALPSAYGQAVDENKLFPLGEPEVEITKLEDGESVEFVAEVDVRPDFTLPAFDSLSATVPALAETHAEVERRIDIMRQRFATLTEVDRPSAVGDQVTIDLTATQDGEPLPDATAEGITYTIGSGAMLDGLDEAVTGRSAGDSVEFSSTLAGGALAGAPADIALRLIKVSEPELPELDDEFAQLVSEFDTVAEMRADLASNVAQLLRSEQWGAAREKVLEDLVSHVEFELPEKLLQAQVDARHQEIDGQLKQAGLTLEGYLASAEEEPDNAEEFWAAVDAGAERGLRAQIVLDMVADQREVGVEQHELTELIVRKAQASGSTPEQELQHMMDHDHMAVWMQEIRRGKALGLVVAEATVTDSDGAPVRAASTPEDAAADAEPASADQDAEPARD